MQWQQLECGIYEELGSATKWVGSDNRKLGRRGRKKAINIYLAGVCCSYIYWMLEEMGDYKNNISQALSRQNGIWASETLYSVKRSSKRCSPCGHFPTSNQPATAIMLQNYFQCNYGYSWTKVCHFVVFYLSYPLFIWFLWTSFLSFSFINWNFFSFFFKDCIYLFLETEEGREKERRRNINAWKWKITSVGCFSHAPNWDLPCNPGLCPDWE